MKKVHKKSTNKRGIKMKKELGVKGKKAVVKRTRNPTKNTTIYILPTLIMG